MMKMLFRCFFLFLSLTLISPALIPSLNNNKVEAAVDTRNVRVNQIGYLPDADKIATVINSSTSPISWQLVNASNNTVVASGTSSYYGLDKASNDRVHKVDFSSFKTTGSYKLVVSGSGESVPFDIGMNLYPNLPKEAMEYFYFHRMGIDISANYLANPAHAHAAFHPGDSSIRCYKDWCGNATLNVKGSWADAGDFGIYPVNHAISAWTLLNLYERYPNVFPDGSLNIPEKGNGIPDILDEVKFGSTFMKGMLPPNGGLASHKVHNEQWSAFPTDPAGENSLPRYAQPPSTNATYAVARTTAQLARVLQPYNSTEAASLWSVAKDAWSRAEANPNVIYSGSVADSPGGGDYDDTTISDDRYAAAVELYLTADKLSDTNKTTYRNAVTGSTHYKAIGEFWWGGVAATGNLSLLTVSNDLPVADLNTIKTNLKTYVDGLVNIINAEGYPVPLSGSSPYPWGSNSSVLNRVILMAYAYDSIGDKTYLKAVHKSMDYLMGNNAMKQSYVTGYGEYYEEDTHDRWAWGKYQQGVAYPKGWLAGGPMNEYSGCDPKTPYYSNAAAKGYAPPNTAPDAYCSKENTVNWNAPLVWVSKYVNLKEADLGGSGNPTPVVPAAPTGLTATAGNAQVNLSWTASSGAISYTVKRATSANGTYTNVATGISGTSYTNTGLTNGTTYYYVVSAVNSAGESVKSTGVSATPTAGTPVPTIPAAPTALTATAGNAQVNLSWTASSGATSYNVKRATTSGGPYTTVATNVTGTSYVNTGLTNGTTYYYVVSAVNTAGESANSAVASASPSGGSTETPKTLVVQYKAADTNATDNQIRPHLNIKNTGTVAVNLSQVKVRYYFTKDGNQSLSAYIDWAQIGASNMQATFGSVSGTNADTYLELSFSAGAGSLAPGAQTGDIQLRIAKSDWSNFNEANDYSFDPTKTGYADWNKVTLYVNGTLAWGIEP